MTNMVYMIFSNVYYLPKVDHRNGSPHKSQWTISEPMEQICFGKAYTSWGQSSYCCWGLCLEKGKAIYLGISKSSAPEKRRLFIAKFIDGNKDSKWHGYPADHVSNLQDIPPDDVRRKWLQEQHLKPATIRKISRGQKCKL